MAPERRGTKNWIIMVSTNGYKVINDDLAVERVVQKGGDILGQLYQGQSIRCVAGYGEDGSSFLRVFEKVQHIPKCIVEPHVYPEN